MILVDTNVLVALVDERDPLHSHALADARRLSKRQWATTDAVLTESIYLLPEPHTRGRLRALLTQANVSLIGPTNAPEIRAIVFDWLLRYDEHHPDWADACLVIASALLPNTKVWTYDREFSAIWRRPDGSAVPLALRK